MVRNNVSISDFKQYQEHPQSQRLDMSVMRIAIAGTGGLARLLARYIQTNTSHHVIFLSRTAQPQLATAGFQVAVVDYTDTEDLQFALRGVDTVISTVTGPAQIQLIHAAALVHVRRFAPAEFEGPPQLSSPTDPRAHARAFARRLLEFYSPGMQSTIFVCGILYERFSPGGLGAVQITNAGVNGEGDYILDCRAMTAQAPVYDENDSPTVTVCLTAMHDVARFVTKALDMRSWPPELRMYSERIQVQTLVSAVQNLRGQNFEVTWHSVATLNAELQVAIAQQDIQRQLRLQALINTAESRYDYAHANLNEMFPNLRPTPFATWFNLSWP